MMNKNYFAVGAATLAMLAAAVVPSRAQLAPAEIPILTQYVGYGAIFFARSEDGSILTNAADANKGYRDGEWSNVWVAVDGSWTQRKIRSMTEIWTDTSGRPHSLSVLKLQLEFNDALKSKYYALGRQQVKIDSLVAESGVLDRATLAIPYTKLGLRADAVAEKLRYERSSGAALSAIDPGSALEKEQFASYVSEKLSEASSKLASLRGAVDAVPLMKTRYIEPSPAHKNSLDGLSGLEFSWQGLTSMARDEYGHVRYYSGDHDVPERSVMEFVDPAGMTPTVVSDLLEKEAAAAKAVGLAESLFTDLFTPL